MSLSESIVSAFLAAASVPRDGSSHESGGLEEAEAIRTSHPEIGQSSIFAAAVLGDEALVRSHLAADPSCAGTKGGVYGWDPLTYLSFSRYLRLGRSRSDGFLRAAEALLSAGAPANSGFFEAGHTPAPTWESVIYGAAGVARSAGLTRLLLEHGADPNDDETPYHAPETYDNSVVQVLLTSGTLTADSLAMMLVRKADWHDYDGVKLLLAGGADPNRMTRWGYTAFHQTLRRDNAIRIVEAMLEHGADAALPTVLDGRSAGELAARRGRGDVLALLERRGVGMRFEGVVALLAACARGDGATAGVMAEDLPQLALAIRQSGGTALAEFSGNGDVEAIATLLTLGVGVDDRYTAGDPYFDIAPGSTALHVAAWRARHAAVSLLIARGADVNAVDGKGRTALELAVRACVDSYWKQMRAPDSVRALLEAGASLGSVRATSGYEEVDRLLRDASDRGG